MQRTLWSLFGVLCIGLTGMLPKDASAQISGWGWGGYSALRGAIDTIHTPPPQTHPTVLVADAQVTVQIACKNPANNGIFPGNSFSSELLSGAQITQGNITDTKGNKATTTIYLVLDAFEVPANCTNPNWIPVVGSAMALASTQTVQWYECTGTDTDPCFEGQSLTVGKLLDQKSGSCTLDLSIATNQRLADGTAPHTAVMTCTPPQ
jgi:hypothetical protein